MCWMDDQCDSIAPGNRVKNPSDRSDPQLPLFQAQIFPQQGEVHVVFLSSRIGIDIGIQIQQNCTLEI